MPEDDEPQKTVLLLKLRKINEADLPNAKQPAAELYPTPARSKD